MGSYRERLSPAPWVWLSVLAVAASSGLVVLPTLGGWAALAVALVAVAVTGWLLVRSSADIEVANGQLRAGRARIPTALLSGVRELDAAQMQALRGPRADARAYLCQRGWISEGVAVSVADAADPTPYWLMSSRRPAVLAAALRTAIADAAGDPPSTTGQAHSRQTS